MMEKERKHNSGPRIIFMGTPEFAVASLDALVNAGYDLIAVVTAPDKPAGRGLKPSMSAVKKYALEHQLNILQPEKLRSPEFIEQLRSLRADMQVVVAFRMLPEMVWNMPGMGTINVHASLLPKYRGAAPINWAIINGEKETGVTTFKLTHEVDTGNILLQRRVSINENDTAGDIHDKLKIAGAELLTLTINGLVNGSITEKPQEMDDATHAPKIFTETCRINWNQPVQKIHDHVRGLSPFPGAFTEWQGKTLKIYRTETMRHDITVPPGTPETDNKKFLRFAGSDGYLYVKELQLEGKKRMSVEDFLRGYRPG
jgi:methionyl-tRNA formyltransferase